MDVTRQQGKFPLALLTEELILVPTPLAVFSANYRALYAKVHSDAAFCNMGFGNDFSVCSWTDEQTTAVINRYDVKQSWEYRAMGDFAVGLRDPATEKRLFGFDPIIKKVLLMDPDRVIWIINGDPEGELSDAGTLDSIEWVGYAGVREFRETNMGRPYTAEELLQDDDWLKRIEVRYGVSSEYWGRAIAYKAAEAVMQWAATERGVKKFIAETQLPNQRSRRVLEKLGFISLENAMYWKSLNQVEWEKVVSPPVSHALCPDPGERLGKHGS